MKDFFKICPCPIIGVTGTKGKRTTASLIYEMLKLSGKDVYAGGSSDGQPFEFTGKLKPHSVVVLELSASQLQDMDKSPHIAVMLGIASEHLGDDGDVGKCVDAMRNILRFQKEDDFAILNRDYPATNESDIHTAGKVFYVSRERSVEEGCFIKEKKVVIKGIGGARERVVIDVKKIGLQGKHNLENVCAAVAASMLGGASMETIKKVLVSFKG